jgi:hypothetical protein
MENEFKRFGKNAWVHDGLKEPVVILETGKDSKYPGFYIGTLYDNTKVEGGAKMGTRESVQIWESKDMAQAALDSGDWRQKGAFQVDVELVGDTSKITTIAAERQFVEVRNNLSESDAEDRWAERQLEEAVRHPQFDGPEDAKEWQIENHIQFHDRKGILSDLSVAAAEAAPTSVPEGLISDFVTAEARQAHAATQANARDRSGRDL